MTTPRTRGWDFERHVRVETTAGEPADLIMGITRDPRDAAGKVGVFAVDDGPSVVLRLDGDVSNGTEISDSIRQTLVDVMRVERRGGV